MRVVSAPADGALRPADRKGLQTRLLLTDRMTSIGTLAAGVAHEINNPLAYVMGNLDYASEEMIRAVKDLQHLQAMLVEAGVVEDQAHAVLERLGEMMGALREAREGAERVSTIVRDLNVFSRGDEDLRAPVDARRVLDSAINMTRNEIKHRARLVLEYHELPLVEANEARLGQVFVNLLLNAAQAITEGQAEKNEILVCTRTGDDGNAVIEVHDTGCGIPKDIIGRLFDPFFTTKPVGVGTGLGLAVCHGIVSSLGGQISVESQVGLGTVFTVSLPPAAKKPQAVPDATDVVAPRRGQVLVVEDDAVVGQSVKRLLMHDHDVAVVTTGAEALKLIESGLHYDVILCDLMMPQMTGMDLHAELVRLRPEQATRMVFLTGGAFTPRARTFLASVANPRLDKPFDAATLRGVIRHCLE